MRHIGRAVLIVLLASAWAAPAQAGPLGDLLPGTPDDVHVPMNNGNLEDRVAELEHEIQRVANDPTADPNEQVAKVLELIRDWSKRLMTDIDCADVDSKVNGSQPLVPPHVEFGEDDGTWVLVDAGAALVFLKVKNDCVAPTPQPESGPGP